MLIIRGARFLDLDVNPVLSIGLVGRAPCEAERSCYQGDESAACHVLG